MPVRHRSSVRVCARVRGGSGLRMCAQRASATDRSHSIRICVPSLVWSARKLHCIARAACCASGPPTRSAAAGKPCAPYLLISVSYITRPFAFRNAAWISRVCYSQQRSPDVGTRDAINEASGPTSEAPPADSNSLTSFVISP